MRFRRGARLDASEVSDRRGRGAGPIAVGGGGIVGLIVLVISLLSGGGGGEGGGGLPVELQFGQEGTDLSSECRTGEDANQRQDCRIVAVINSVQAHWRANFPGYRPATTVFFTDAVATGCGSASSAVGPFYCPLDQRIYIDLSFYDELRGRFGASGGSFAEAYVIAHEYGHHLENQLGVLGRARSGDTGPQSAAVRVELMADCLAGMWARGAVATGFVEELTDADIRDGLDAAAAVGDDRIQEHLQTRVASTPSRGRTAPPNSVSAGSPPGTAGPGTTRPPSATPSARAPSDRRRSSRRRHGVVVVPRGWRRNHR